MALFYINKEFFFHTIAIFSHNKSVLICVVAGKTETYNEDMRVILAEYGVADPQTMITESYSFRRENEKHHDTKKLYQDYWESIKPKTIKRLQEIYSRDFEYFDYPTKPL